MGLSNRFFLIEDNDSIRSISIRRFTRLVRQEATEPLAEYAGKKMRYVHVVVRIENRDPVEIVNFICSKLPFDQKGYVDKKEMDRIVQLSLESVKEPFPSSPNENVVEARHLFAQKRLQQELTWVPSSEIVAAIEKKIWRMP